MKITQESIDQFLSDKAANSRLRYSGHLKRFIELAGDDINPESIIKFKSLLVANGGSSVTINQQLSVISSFCKFFHIPIKITSVPVEADLRERRILNEQEVSDLLMYSPPDLQVAIQFILQTGCSLSELCALSYITLNTGGVPPYKLPVRKGEVQKDIFLTKYLMEQLTDVNGLIFGRLWNKDVLRRKIREAATKADILGGDVNVPILRNTAIVNMLRAGIPHPNVAKILGVRQIPVALRNMVKGENTRELSREEIWKRFSGLVGDAGLLPWQEYKIWQRLVQTD